MQPIHITYCNGPDIDAVRAVVPTLQADRPCGPDAMAVQESLFAPGLQAELRDAVANGMAGYVLRGV